MASIKKLDTRKFKITVSNGYRPDGRKISRAKTIKVPNSVGGRGIPQYVAHEAEEFEKLVKSGYCEDGEMTFQETLSAGWDGRRNMHRARLDFIADRWKRCIRKSAISS